MTTKQIIDRTKQILANNKIEVELQELINFSIVYAVAQKDLLEEQLKDLKEKIK